MANLSDEELAELEKADRHAELIEVLQALVDKKQEDHAEAFAMAVKPITDAVKSLELCVQTNKPIDLKPLMDKISDALKALKPLPTPKPAVFKIERLQSGLIDKIVVES